MKTDKLLYRLLQDHPELAFQLASLPPPQAEYQLRSEEVKEIQFRLDGILEPPSVGPATPMLFLENQFHPDDDFYARWFGSVFIWLRRHPEQRHWRGVVLFPNRAMDQGSILGYEEFFASGRVAHVYLEDWLKAPSPPPEIRLVLLLLAPEEQAIAQARALLEGEAPSWQDYPDWVETLLVYKLPRLTREEIRIMLHSYEIDLKHTVFYQEVFAEGESNVLLRLLRRRCGPLEAAQEARVHALSQEKRAALADALLDFRGPEDFAAWLKRSADT
jgi:predicted transposase/invertase (TIGR01784 family)